MTYAEARAFNRKIFIQLRYSIDPPRWSLG